MPGAKIIQRRLMRNSNSRCKQHSRYIYISGAYHKKVMLRYATFQKAELNKRSNIRISVPLPEFFFGSGPWSILLWGTEYQYQ